MFSSVFKSFLATSLLIENTKLRLALFITTGAPITGANEAIQTNLLVADKTGQVLSKLSNYPLVSCPWQLISVSTIFMLL